MASATRAAGFESKGRSAEAQAVVAQCMKLTISINVEEARI
jgi:hypothetical protein